MAGVEARTEVEYLSLEGYPLVSIYGQIAFHSDESGFF